jgi:long-chain acyl-CoA synthetase
MNDFHSWESTTDTFIIDQAGHRQTYGAIEEKVFRRTDVLASLPRPSVLFLYTNNSTEAIATYFASLRASVPVCLCEPNRKAFEQLVTFYKPSALALPIEIAGVEGYEIKSHLGPDWVLWHLSGSTPFAGEVHPKLSVLLTTSGSTGSVKLVRLSERNLIANAKAIANYLELSASERPILSLPLQYSYGLSVLNSHMVVGASVVLTNDSFIRPEFWNSFAEHSCSSFAGVPYSYETLHRLGWSPKEHSSLRYFTQAGGSLKTSVMSHYLKEAEQNNQRFFVMYGQTEATARISYVPPNQLFRKLGSIGIPISGGTLMLDPFEDRPGPAELVYSGPNVMLGYAEQSGDLAKGDVQHGILKTGDLARIDEDGFYYLEGRIARFAKLFGKRMNLTDIETLVEDRFGIRAVALDMNGYLQLLAEQATPDSLSEIRQFLAERIEVTPVAIRTQSVSSIPLTSSGKKNYGAFAK